ncbi:MAG: extracellular solute-binding protein [Firmicutes bacterium]|nr:extracellular solute-binding protein [Bacillota bacterium]
MFRLRHLPKLLLFTAVIILLTALPRTVMAQNGIEGPEPLFERREPYREFLDRYADAVQPDAEIVIPGIFYSATDMNVAAQRNPFGHEGTALYTEERGFVEWTVNVPEAGLYNLEILYYPVQGRGSEIVREITINGEKLFAGSESLIFHRVFSDAGPFLRDSAGNEIRPQQVENPRWRRVYLADPLGFVMEPFLFYFEEGINTIRLSSVAEPMLIAEMRLKQAPRPPAYAEALEEFEKAGYTATKGHQIFVQGEDATIRSSPSLFAVSDQGDPTLMPYHPAEIRLNSFGGHRWQVLGDWATWEFEVPESGLYEIAIKSKQDVRRGVFSTRRIRIDGEVPYRELDSVGFNYSPRYEMKRLGLDTHDEPFLFYLEKGKHEISLEAVLGDLADLLFLTEEALYELTSIYRSIIMITSTTPDPMRSYQLDRRIPNLLKRLDEQSRVLTEMAIEFESLTGQRGGHLATLTDLSRMLDRMVDKPESIPNLLKEYRDGIGSLGTWVMDTRNQPLQIDYMVISSPGEKLPRATPTRWEVFMHEIRAFLASFVHDYTGVLDISETESASDLKSIKVWIGSGRDQAHILKQMIEDDFTPQTGIQVKLELVNDMQSLLIPTIIAGTQPDVALGAANMDLAFRGAVHDLSKFPDFEEVSQRFRKSALLSFRFRDQVFALPETQNFPMLFYRKDILTDLGQGVPQTWDDLYALLPELHNNHLEFGMAPNMGTYATFLYQKGVALYKEDAIAANLESEAAIATFEQMTNLYTQSGLPLQYDFINRFRMGEMPLAVADYGEYNTLAVFAPELRGAWGMAPIPGTVQPDGTINRTAPHNTGGAIILDNSENKDEAWEFLKWWTSTESQVRFGREMEALMGAAARYATANVEAMQRLPWTMEERDNLNTQWEWVEGMPPVLGGYYITRQFDWLFRAVVLQNEPVRESVLDYSREINREITRKRIEFGLETDMDKLDPKYKELYWNNYTHVYRLDVDDDRTDEEYRDVLERRGVLEDL